MLSVVFNPDSEVGQKALKYISSLHIIRKSKECRMMALYLLLPYADLFSRNMGGGKKIENWNKMKEYWWYLFVVVVQVIAGLQGK